MTHDSGAVLWAIALGSLAVKLGFIAYLDGRAYTDVLRALDYGYLVRLGVYRVDAQVINSKTFVGPLLWFALFDRFGFRSLLAFNLLAFVGMLLVQLRLGRGRFAPRTRTIALLLFAFYVGTNRSIVAGEADDNLATLLLGAGILLYLERKLVLAAAALLGIAFLFKFWIAIFALGFLAFLALRAGRSAVLLALLGLAIPFGLMNLADGFASLHTLFVSLRIQSGYSSWGEVGVKLLTTGMLPAVALSAWAWHEDRGDVATLLFFVSAAYLPYVFVQRDAFAATTVMMPCLLFSAFLIAEWLVRHVPSVVGAIRPGFGVAGGLTYVLATVAVTYVNLYRDTRPVVLVRNAAETRIMFRYNPLRDDAFDSITASVGSGARP